METLTLQKKLSYLLKQRNLFAFSTLCLIATNFILAISLLNSKKSVVLLPSTITSEMGISEDKMSENYLKSFARDIILTSLNVTPVNIDRANKVILEFVPSDLYAIIKKELDERALEIKKKGISQHFFITEIEVQNSDNVIIKGELSIYIGGNLIETSKKSYLVSLKISNMIVKLIELLELNESEI